MYIYIGTYVYIYIHMYIYIYVYMYIHYVYIYMFTYHISFMNTAYIGTPVKYIYVMCYLTTFLRCDIPVSICIQKQCRYNVDHRDTMIIKSYCTGDAMRVAMHKTTTNQAPGRYGDQSSHVLVHIIANWPVKTMKREACLKRLLFMFKNKRPLFDCCCSFLTSKKTTTFYQTEGLCHGFCHPKKTNSRWLVAEFGSSSRVLPMKSLNFPWILVWSHWKNK